MTDPLIDTGVRWCVAHDGIVDVDEDTCDSERTNRALRFNPTSCDLRPLLGYRVDPLDCDACHAIDAICPYHVGVADGAGMVAEAVAFAAEDVEWLIESVHHTKRRRAETTGVER